MSGFTPRTRPHSIIIPRDRLHAGIVLYSDLQTIETTISYLLFILRRTNGPTGTVSNTSILNRHSFK